MNTKSIAVTVAVALPGAGGTVVYAQPAATEQAGQPAAVEVGNMCKKDFSKDPEKFSKIAEDEVAATQANGS